MKQKSYILIIVLLSSLSFYLFLTHKRDCKLVSEYSNNCFKEQGHKRGAGLGFGMANSLESNLARKNLFSLIVNGESDTSIIFQKLEEIVEIQRNNQKIVLLKLISKRDSLKGDDREIFLKKLNHKFCRVEK